MQAIQTRYLPETTFRPARIKAWCERGEITISVPDTGDPHRAAVDALVDKFITQDEAKGQPRCYNPWLRPYVSGVIRNGDHVHVSVPVDVDHVRDMAPALLWALKDLHHCHQHGNGAEAWDRVKRRARDVIDMAEGER